MNESPGVDLAAARVIGALTSDAPPLDAPDIDAFRDATLALDSREAHPVDGAMLAAARADRLGFAFAAGYRSALASLVPSLRGKAAALAATESGGGHPRAIESTIVPTTGGEGFVIRGEKQWVTMGGEGSVWLVIAREPALDANERPVLRLVAVDCNAPGVAVTLMGDVPFVPEIPHARARFDDVTVARDAVLPGDGYADYLKPFRTIEDVHVHAALLAFLATMGRRHGVPRALTARLVMAAMGSRTLASIAPSDPSLHVALSASIEGARPLFDEVTRCASIPDDVRTHLERDRPLMAIASKARAARLARAWQQLDGG